VTGSVRGVDDAHLMQTPRPTSNVIQLADYLSRQARQELPLFARPLRREAVDVTPLRPLSTRQVEHRARMLEHLRTV
jgi:hypothetical protein